MELPKNLELRDVEDLQNDPIHLVMINKDGHRIYYAKMSAGQVTLLNYKVGDEVLITTIGLAGIMRFYVNEIRRMLVKRDHKYEIHLHVEVDAFPPVPPAF